MGAFRKRKVTLPRDILYPRKRYGGRTETSQRLQYQTTPNADDVPKHALFTAVRQKRFQRDRQNDVVQSVRYLLKYIEKSGERLVYGGDLPTYFKSDVMDEDIACHTGIDDRKALLFDDFNCWDEGCLIGKVSPETISQLPKCN